MQVIGSANEARNLSTRLKNNVKMIKNASFEEERDLKRLGSTFKDDGFDEMRSIVEEIIKALSDSIDDIAGVCLALNKYADILDEN